MNSTSTQSTFNFAKDLVDSFNSAISEAVKQAYRMMWDTAMSFLTEHWIAVLFFLLVILIIAIIKAIMGRWGMLGSVFYHYLYFGILFIIGLIWGSDIFVSNIFSVLCVIILYPVCYFVTGLILEKIGVK